MAISENTINIINYLKEHKDENLTSADVAEALGVAKATVNGAFTSIQKKGLGVRVDATVDGTATVKFLTMTDEGRAADLSEMGDTVNAIMNYLGKASDHVTLDDLAAGIGLEKRSVNGSFNALVKKGLCARTDATIAAPVAVKYLKLTDAGLAWTGEEAEA